MADDAQLVDSSAKAETEDTDSGQPDKLNEGDPDRADAATAAAKEAESAASAVASKKKLQRPSSGQMPASTAHKEPLKQRPKTGSNYKYKRDLLRSRDVQAIATELAKDAMVDRQNYLEMKTAHLSKVEEARQRRKVRMAVSKTTLTTPKTLAYDKHELLEATAPKWKHTWDNSDPHEVSDAMKQIDKTTEACRQQDAVIFNKELEAKQKHAEVQKKKAEEFNKSVLQQSMAATAKEKTIIEKVYSQRLEATAGEAMRQIEQEKRSQVYKTRLEKQKEEDLKKKAAEKEMRIQSARKKAEDIAKANSERKLQLSIESELKRRALKGREEKVRAFEEKLQRNRVRSATMKNRIHESREQFEDFCRQKHVAILQSLDRSSVQRDRLVSARSVKVAAGQVQREALHRQRLRDVLVGQEAYCDSKMEKIVANGTKLEQMKAAKRRAQKEWLDAQRAEIYDHFMKNEILIDTLNCKKIREDFAGMLMQSYPIVERRPQTSR